MENVAEELRKYGEAILAIAEKLSKPREKTPELPVEKQPTLEEVRAVLAAKARDGFTADVRTLLLKYGADKLSGVNPGDYQALLAEAEGIRHE